MMGDAGGRGHSAAAPAPWRSRRTPHSLPAGTKLLLGHAMGTSSGTKIFWFLGGSRRNHMTLTFE